MEVIENFVRMAKAAGIKQAQLERFLLLKYVPFPWQMIFHKVAEEADMEGGPVDIGVGGARGPGKSHGVFAQVVIDDLQRVPGLKGLFLRQTGKAAKESFEDLIDAVLRGKASYKYNSSSGSIHFENGSRLLLGGFENENDVEKYVGIQYDVMAVEELNQLTEEKVIKLKGSLRTSKPGWKPRMYTSFNPGGIGHNFIKEHYIIPFREGKQTTTRFIPANYKDNPLLNQGYVDYLEGLTGNLGKAWREGDWDIFEGQYFTEWRNERHTCQPFEVPDSWVRYRSYDHGRSKPACCKWYAVDYDGRVWVYREYYPVGVDADEIAKEIVRLSGKERYRYSVADPSIFSNTGMIDRKTGAQTIAEIFARYGVAFIRGNNNRIHGWATMHQYLKWTEEERPKLIYFSTCTNSIRTIPMLRHDDHRPEDLNSDGEDHAADVDRYLLQSLHEVKAPKPTDSIQLKIEKLRRTKFDISIDFYANQI